MPPHAASESAGGGGERRLGRALLRAAPEEEGVCRTAKEGALLSRRGWGAH